MTLPHHGVAAPSRRLWSRDYVLTMLTGHFLFVSYTSMFTVIPNYVKDLGGENWHVGVVVGAFGVLSLFVRPYVGRLIAMFGPKPVAVLGLASFALAALLYVLPVNNWLEATPLLANVPALAFLWPVPVRMLRGIGLAATPVATSTIVVNLAPAARRAEALAYMGIGIGTASMYSPFLTDALASRFGFSAAFFFASFAALLGCLFSMALSSQRTNPVAAEPAGRREKTPLIPRAAILPTLIFVSFTATTGPVNSFMPIVVAERELGNPGLFYTVNSLVMMVSLLGSGRVADRFGRSSVILPGLVSVAMGMFMLMYAANQLMFIGSAVLTGWGFGLLQPGMQSLVVDRVTPRERGPAMATLQSAWDIGNSGTSFALGPVATIFGAASTFGVVGLGAVAGAFGFAAAFWRDKPALPEDDDPAGSGDEAGAQASAQPLAHTEGRGSAGDGER